MSNNVFDIEVEGEFIDLPESSFRYEVVNALLTTELYQGDWSFPLDVPDTPKNSRIFGYSNKIDTNNITTEFSAWLYLYGIPRFLCMLNVTRGKIRSFSITLHGGIKALPNVDKKLVEINLGEDYLLGNSQASSLATAKLAAECGDWKVYGFTFVPFYAPNFYAGKNSFFLGVCNRVNSTTGDLIGNSLSTVNNKYNLVAWLFLYYVLDKVFKDAGLEPSGPFWEHAELSKLLLFSNYAIEIRPEAGNTKVLLVNDNNLTVDGDKIDFDLGPKGTYDNAAGWDESINEYIIKAAGWHTFQWQVIYEVVTSGPGGVWPPYMHGGLLEIVLDGVVINTVTSGGTEGDLGWSELGDGDQVKILTKKLLFSSGDIGKSIYLRYKHSTILFQTAVYIIVKSNSSEGSTSFSVKIDAASLPSTPPNFVKYKDHVPDLTVGSLLAELKKMGVDFNFDTPGKVIINTADNIINYSEAIDISEDAGKDYDTDMEDRGKGTSISYEFPEEEKADLVLDKNLLVGEFFSDEQPEPAAEGTYSIVIETNEVYKVVKNGSNLNEWELAGYNYPPFKIGRGENELKMKLAPMQMTIQLNEGGTSHENEAIMPYYPGTGSSSLFGLGINPFEPRLIFYRGPNQNGSVSIPRGGKYVLATTGIYGINRNIVGQMCFRLDSTQAITRTTSGALLNALNEGRVIEKPISLNAVTLAKIKSTSRLVIDFNLFLIKNISIELRRSIAVAKAYLLKL